MCHSVISTLDSSYQYSLFYGNYHIRIYFTRITYRAAQRFATSSPLGDSGGCVSTRLRQSTTSERGLVLGAGVHDSGQTHRSKGITKFGRKELRWALVEAAWQGLRANPRWRAEYDALCKRKHPNQAIVAIARQLLVTLWYLLNNQEAYNHSSDEDLAYKMLTWSWHIDKSALNGMTRQQFAKYGLIRLGKGEDLTRIVRGGLPRRIAPKEEVLALKPGLLLKQ